MRRVLVGLDLNGRADFAARDRAADDPDLEVAPFLVSGGAAGEIVRTAQQDESADSRKMGRPIAGPQARLAPHGRGPGWGSIGQTDHRRPLAPAIDHPGLDDASEDLRAAVDALARGADDVVLTVPDLADFNETRQGEMLRAVTAAGRGGRRARLLWRPVAAFLDLMEQGLIPANPVGTDWDILVHGPGGIEAQRLTLVADPGHPQHRAPRRDGPGRLVCRAAGLDAMLSRARTAVESANPAIIWGRCEPTRLGAALLTGDACPGEFEILRTWNGTWTSVTAPELTGPDILPDPEPVIEAAPGAAGRFLVTPLATSLAEALARMLAPAWPGLRAIHSGCIARGALRAGRLIERGLPHYFDRIEPIRIAVLRGRDPVWADLIGPDEVVPANREFVSEPLEDFRWPTGKPEIEFYVCKGAAEVRHWTAEKDRGPDRPVDVILRVRQTPGQSWARLSITGSDWDLLARSPVSLDWENCAPLNKTPEEVLESLRRPPPTIPDRIVERPHAALWHSRARWARPGNAGALARAAFNGEPVLTSHWADLLPKSMRDQRFSPPRVWHVGSDGDLPPELTEEERNGFEIALNHIASELLDGTPQRGNSALRAATWCFTACPDPVQELIVEALEAYAAIRYHPLLAGYSKTVLKQGAGRAVQGAGRLRRLLTVFAASNLDSNDLNALAMILSRRAEAPEALSRELVDQLLGRLGPNLEEQVGAGVFKVKFYNTLSAIAGLFRWRERERDALLAASDPAAAELRGVLERARPLLPGSRHARKLDLINSIIEYLEGGGNPSILVEIEIQTDDLEDDG